MNVLTEARNQLLDTDSGNYRWTDGRLASYANEGQDIIIAARPDAIAKNDNGLIDDPASISTTTGEPAVFADWHMALVDFIMSRALETDDGDEQNAKRAETHRKQFYNRLKV